MIFNGRRVQDLIISRFFSVPPYSGRRTRSVEVAGRSGAHFIDAVAEPRVIPVNVFYKYSNWQEQQQIKERLNAHLITDAPKVLIFDYEPNRYYNAIVEGSLDLTENVVHDQGTITFVCYDPFKYSTATRMFSGTQVQNQGTEPTFPRITLTMTQASQGFSVSLGDKTCRVLWNFHVGDTLVIDMNSREVFINGQLRMTALDWRSEMFAVPTGTHHLTLSGGATIQVALQERWR